MPIIQIIFKLSTSLTKYQSEVNRGKYEFPDFSDSCPICDGYNCARFHGYYYRPVVTEEGIYYKSFPIARYKCRKTGNKKAKHRTFSLLPHELLPYVKYSTGFIFRILFNIHIHNMSVKEVLDIISRLCSKEVLSISPMTVHSFKNYILKGTDRPGISWFSGIANIINTTDRNDRFKLFIIPLWHKAYKSSL